MLSQNSRAVLEALLPPDAHPDLRFGIFDAGFDDFWVEFERTTLPAWRWGFRATVFTAVWIAPLLIRRLPPLTRHDPPTRERALAALGATRFYPFRQMLQLLKTIVCFSYGADPQVRAAIGYPRQPDDPPGETAA